VLEDGTFSTYSLPSFYNHRETGERDKRSAGTADKLHLVLSFNGIDHHVELSPYHEFISPDMVVEIRGAGISTDLNEGLKFKRASDQQCHYRGHVRGQHRSRAALSLCNGVVGTSHCPFCIIFAVTRPGRERANDAITLAEFLAVESETRASINGRVIDRNRDQGGTSGDF